MKYSIAVCFLILCALGCLDAALVTLYKNVGHTGDSYRLEVDSCVNLPSAFNDKVSSVHTHDTCVILCEHTNCQGRCERVGPGDGTLVVNHGWLEHFNDQASSVKPC